MEGRMRPYLPELTIRDYNTYLWYLRGVRWQMYRSYGLYSCRLQQHNGVLFALLADSLAGRPATCKAQRLPGTLCRKQMMCQTQGIRLAAQVEVMLGWHKLQDRRWDELPLRGCAAPWTAPFCAELMKRRSRKILRWNACSGRNRHRRWSR